ncbi:MAG: hypothetical protein KDA93_22775 [Planctomycetaceae bacterium]|nr:hypothetical protein [Planctomycetaceae bacterium]
MILREECSDLPDGFWVIQRHEDGAFCLDVNRKMNGDEYAVVDFESGTIQHERALTRDYHDFVNRWFIETWERSTE